MEIGQDNIRRLFNELKTFSFWDRLFRWGTIKTLLIETSAELQKLISHSESLQAGNIKLENSINRLAEDKENFQKELSTLKEKNENYLKRGTELATELSAIKQKIELLDQENKKLREENTQYKTFEEQKRIEYDKSVTGIHKIQEQLTRERSEEKEKRYQAEIERIKKLKETWSTHEQDVANRIKAICSRHGVEYMDTVPFKGKPDNTLKINEEFIILDAKSPAGEDLSNFPIYLKNQAENVSKYIKEDGVRREIFLVVPTNTLEIIQHFEYKLSDYTVYIISNDSLEPIILALRKIEDYEFAEQLSPEERENICRVIGKFVHLSKRRIQIDGFFAKQFFELVYRSEADLPRDILEKTIEFERAEKLNPPIERRARQINNKELENEIRDRKTDAEQKGIEMDESMLSKNLNKLPLYSDKPTEESQKTYLNNLSHMVEPLTTITVLGIRIDEPVTTLTNLILSATCMWSYFKITAMNLPDKTITYFRFFFLMMGIATLIGGLIGHGFLYLLSFGWKLPGWITSMLSIALIERSSIEHARPYIKPNVGKFFLVLNVVELLAIMTIAMSTLSFRWIELHTAYGLLAIVVPFHFVVYYYTKDKGSLMIIMAVGIATIGSLFYMYKISPHPWFNHIDISHVILTIAIFYFYNATDKLKLSISPTPAVSPA
ncbi:MAG: hypothetical protein HC811_01105 [Flammeovirgaceae bacterium]|nr:hypothetical protein [Flammeovirgaceae bacterium]